MGWRPFHAADKIGHCPQLRFAHALYPLEYLGLKAVHRPPPALLPLEDPCLLYTSDAADE